MGCDHKFCSDCYRGYVVNAVGTGPACILLNCPEHKCDEALPSTLFEKLCDEKSLKRYRQFVLRHYVEQSKTLRFCPAPGYEKIAMGSGVNRVTCDCGHNFVSNAVKRPTSLPAVHSYSNGTRSARVRARQRIGSLSTPNARNAIAG